MYHSIALATTFSPRFLALLSEAGRVARYFQAPLCLIHAGVETPEKLARFQQGLSKTGLPPDTKINWVPGDPALTIPKAAKDLKVDLLIAGALEKEAGYRPFANDIARTLLSTACADLFLFLHPKEEPNPVHCPAVVLDFSPASALLLAKTMGLASAQACEKVHAIQVLTTFDERRLHTAGDDRDPEARFDEFVMASTSLEVPVETKCIRGNTGFTACEYVQELGVDLLGVTTGLPGSEHTILHPTLDWLYQVIPCNLWVIRERAE